MQTTTVLLQHRYEIVRPIAQGEWGAVYEGRDWRQAGKSVAIKLSVFNTDEQREFFARAASMRASLSHLNLPKVHGLFNEGAGLYVVMEYVPGNNLAEMLPEFASAFEYRTVLVWAEQLLAALIYLHSANPPIIHHDIKLANLKLTPQGQVMLLDFGLARENLNGFPIANDTANDTPVEQPHPLGNDPRADLYALGATLFHLLTGTPTASAQARLTAIANQQPDPQPQANELVPAIPLLVSQAIHRALALDRATGFQSAREMRVALRLALKTLPPVQRSAEASQSAPHADHPLQRLATLPRPVIVKPARKMATTTVPMPAAKLAQRHTRWQAAVSLLILLAGGTGMGLLAEQFLGSSSANLPALATSATPASLPAQFTNRFGTHFTLIPTGHFVMGDSGANDTQPMHKVTLAQPFYLGTHELTQQQWRSLMHQNPSLHKGPNLPVENITWFDAQKYVAQINLLSDGYRYRLPTEAEWEYAACAGRAEEVLSEPARYAWFKANTKSPQPIGQKEPNGFGLYDMLGNVAEWCADAYHESYLGAPTDGEAWTAATGLKLYRVMRGASWFSPAETLHPTFRSYDEPHNRNGKLGLRLVAEKLPEPAIP